MKFLDCKKNVFCIKKLKEKFSKLENKYFHLDINRQNKIGELEQILKKKLEEKTKIRKILDIYDYRDIEELSYNELLEIKKKINLSLDLIKNIKQRSKNKFFLE